MRKRHFLSTAAVLCVLAGICVLTGCRKKPSELTESPETPAKQPQPKSDFESSPGVIVCDLKEVKLDTVELPQRPPYFVRDMQRNNKDTLLKGELVIAGAEYIVLVPAGDNVRRQMALYDKSKKLNPSWWGADEIKSVRKIGGKFYEFEVLENPSKFAARPYAGDTGVFKVGKGDRQLEKAEFQGSIQSSERSAAVGNVDERGWTKPVGECSIPVGDYRPAIMSVIYDNLSVRISYNYHRDEQGRTRSDRESVYGFKISKDTPYVLDFSNTPAIAFNTPAPDKNRFKLGEQIKFAAVLVDPKLDIMVRGLTDTSVKIDKEYTDTEGKKHTYQQDKSLDPTVVISRADGEVVAEGVMPFG